MELQNDKNRLIIELNFKVQIKDYRLRFITKKGWLIAGALLMIKAGLILYQSLTT